MDAIVAEEVTRRYGETVAVDDVSLSIGAGEIFALVGPNGAGKTTLVRALTGTTDYSGRVELFGQPPGELDRERIGVLPQDFTPAERLTARELVAYYGGLYDEARDPNAVLSDVGMAEATDSTYETLSGGQQRRTCVATALVNDPDLLVLDEPTTGIDPAGRRRLWRLLEELASTGTTIFVTTHYMAEAERLADRVGLLDDGQLVAVDTPDALVAEYGGESLLQVEGTLSGVDRAIENLPYEADHTGNRLTLRDVPPEAIGEVVDTLSGAGVEYESLTWTEPDLEDVYLAVTGRAVDEGGNVIPTERGDHDTERPQTEETTA
jgi:ABC-2 type transport system ATP-binding protein